MRCYNGYPDPELQAVIDSRKSRQWYVEVEAKSGLKGMRMITPEPVTQDQALQFAQTRFCRGRVKKIVTAE
jgi:hypothetical protein